MAIYLNLKILFTSIQIVEIVVLYKIHVLFRLDFEICDDTKYNNIGNYTFYIFCADAILIVVNYGTKKTSHRVMNITKGIMGTGLNKKEKDISFLKNENIYLLGESKLDNYLEVNYILRLRNLKYIQCQNLLPFRNQYR